jgi:hypothetical protein
MQSAKGPKEKAQGTEGHKGPKVYTGQNVKLPTLTSFLPSIIINPVVLITMHLNLSKLIVLFGNLIHIEIKAFLWPWTYVPLDLFHFASLWPLCTFVTFYSYESEKGKCSDSEMGVGCRHK